MHLVKNIGTVEVVWLAGTTMVCPFPITTVWVKSERGIHVFIVCLCVFLRLCVCGRASTHNTTHIYTQDSGIGRTEAVPEARVLKQSI